MTLWQSYHRDNPALHDGRDWTDAGRKYLTRLNRLTGSRRKRLLEGLWAAGEGAWFDGFDAKHVTIAAEYDPRRPVYLAVDSGVHTGAVFFQVNRWGAEPTATVFGDFYAFNRPAFVVAGQIIQRAGELCRGRVDVGLTDPAGGAATAVGPTVLGNTTAPSCTSNLGRSQRSWMAWPWWNPWYRSTRLACSYTLAVRT